MHQYLSAVINGRRLLMAREKRLTQTEISIRLAGGPADTPQSAQGFVTAAQQTR